MSREPRGLYSRVSAGFPIPRQVHLGELEMLASRGVLRGVLDRIGSLRRGVVSLQENITKNVELSNSKNIRMKSLSQVAVGAIIYGLCFPTIAYYILCLAGFRTAGLGSAVLQY